MFICAGNTTSMANFGVIFTALACIINTNSFDNVFPSIRYDNHICNCYVCRNNHHAHKDPQCNHPHLNVVVDMVY